MSAGSLGYETTGEDIQINAGRTTVSVLVANTGDRAVQVGSHYHFYEANAALSFDRDVAYGKHLAIPAGLAVRFEPGDDRVVELVDFGGRRILYGFSNIVNGALDDPQVKATAEKKLEEFLKNSNAESNVLGISEQVAGEEKKDGQN
ncbi:urease subunit beta [Corynebacterium auriscanis]|uniref:urease subunit beta n=1 Tax=Corynebacterium auriscanis TaxID=99807 RepID=UPI002247CCA3|nr:urease subunit beta [Corynebacterium auriscanis]MCX2162648.1 urease subunit beta [Corynebacterium auriscanis]